MSQIITATRRDFQYPTRGPESSWHFPSHFASQSAGGLQLIGCAFVYFAVIVVRLVVTTPVQYVLTEMRTLWLIRSRDLTTKGRRDLVL